MFQTDKGGNNDLYVIYNKILKHRRKSAPVFSGNLGEYIYENSAKMLELFKNLPMGPGEVSQKN